MLAAALALRGFAVALVHHSDGSSSFVDLKPPISGPGATSWLKYQHPNYSPSYDVAFRQRQAEYRAEEVEEARLLVLAMKGLAIDPAKVVVAGFSFGAATAGVVAALNPHAYAAAVFIDGWWHIELKKYNVAQDLPLQAHSMGISLPALFVGSAEFQGYDALNDATNRIQAKAPIKEVHVLPNTRHGNFMDAVWWMPVVVTKKLGFSGAADPHLVYVQFAVLVADFVDRHTKGKIKN
jgi:dienelactone hydrolase